MAAPQIATNGNAASNPAGFISFKGMQGGILLPSIDGYPPDLPQLQLTADNRLCFWNFPKALTDTTDWIDLSKVTGVNTTPPITAPCSLTSISEAWQKAVTKKPITKEAANALYAAFAADRNYNSGTQTYTVKPGVIPALIARKDFYQAGQYWESWTVRDWLFQNVQYYINRYLKNPYDINQLIPYGTNWTDQMIESVKSGKISIYLDNCNFLVQPVGSKTFWDSFYLAVPLLITAAATIVTAGGASPTLLAAIGAATALVKSAEKAGAAGSVVNAGVHEGTPIVNVPVVTSDVKNLTTDDSNYFLIAAAVAVIIIIVIAV